MKEKVRWEAIKLYNKIDPNLNPQMGYPSKSIASNSYHCRYHRHTIPPQPLLQNQAHPQMQMTISSQQVVSACVQSGCDCLDICGEPEFMEKIEANYNEKAAEKGALVVLGCGFDCG